MKKFVSIVTTLILGISSIIAQDNYTLVKGFVVDRNGNPIPGAEVMTPGGGESVITDSDGSFNISVHRLLKKLSATYDGMTTKTLRITPDKELVFALRSERKNPAFINILLGYSHNMHGLGWYHDDTDSPSWGIMAGMLSKWGFYGKGNSDWNGNFGVTAGVIKSLYKRVIFMYAGAGYGMAWRREDNHEYYGTWRESIDSAYHPGIAADFGFIFKTGRHFNLIIGYNLLSTFSFTVYNDVSVGPNFVHGLQAGIGYVF